MIDREQLVSGLEPDLPASPETSAENPLLSLWKLGERGRIKRSQFTLGMVRAIGEENEPFTVSLFVYIHEDFGEIPIWEFGIDSDGLLDEAVIHEDDYDDLFPINYNLWEKSYPNFTETEENKKIRLQMAVDVVRFAKAIAEGNEIKSRALEENDQAEKVDQEDLQPRLL